MSALLRRRVPAFWFSRSISRRFASRSVFEPSVAAESSETGLYGFELLKTPKGFRWFADEAIQRSGELVSYISRLPPSAEIVRAMDEISDTVCSVVDSAELCRNTHPNREFVEEANNACTKMYDYLHALNTMHDLYNAVIRAEQSGNLQTEEAQKAAHTLRIDFEKGGIHLCAEKLDRVNELNNEIARLGREYSENVAIDPGSVDVYPASHIPKSIQHLLRPIHRTTSGTVNHQSKEKGFRIRTDPGTLSSVLKWTADDDIRKRSYISGNSVPKANLKVLDRLIAARDELAQIMGYKSYAEFAVHPNMASSPDVVMSFLKDLSKAVEAKADEEFKAIRDFKRKICNEKSVDLEPWDEAYFTEMMKSSSFNVDSSVVASYFPLTQCIEGLKVLVESLFGATFRTVPLAPGESWHSDVLKLSLHHPEEGDLGYLYLDLYSRPGKYPICAHFAIKGARRLSATEYQLPNVLLQRKVTDFFRLVFLLNLGSVHVAVVALVCNFSASPGSSTARLQHWELETLFHEFGHALHSLLSRTDYQHFSGTRVVLDLAETPANLFEYYAWDYRVLRKFARHVSTGDVIPEALVKSMNDAKRMFAATELQRQILYSSIDQTLFGEQVSPARDTVSIVADLKSEYTRWNNVEGTHWHTRFNHLINYGGGYYSYLYAKSFAATIWHQVCLEEPLSSTTGFALRTKFLQHGGAKDAAQLLKDIVGDDVLIYHNQGIIPNISSLCKEMNL